MKNGLLGALLILAAIALAILLSGCGKKTPKPSPNVPILFKHCDFKQDGDGRQGCNCPTPLIVRTLDATTGKPLITAYCDGKVN